MPMMTWIGADFGVGGDPVLAGVLSNGDYRATSTGC
jgi:hypothetical protein